MSQSAPTLPNGRTSQEFWKPQRPTSFRVENCEACSNELVIGSRYCHICGHSRDSVPHPAAPQLTDFLDWGTIRNSVGLSTVSLVLAIAGFAFGLAAIFTGILNTATNALDWQAIQIWRTEWLFAALVAFVAAILFKK